MSTDYIIPEVLEETPTQELPYLLPKTKKGYKYVHVSKPSLLATQLLGPKQARELVNAKGTFCRKCELKKLAAAAVMPQEKID